MSIERSGPVPPFWQYAVETVLVPQTAAANNNLLNLQTANLRWVHIPTYQRGISWVVDNVQEFLQSDSVLLGNVILAQFSRQPGNATVRHLSPNVNQYHVLVDGLQRLAVGTSLLALLHPLVLAQNATLQHEAPLFSGLSALVLSRSPAYLHNDNEFLNHPRKAIKDQYLALRNSLVRWIEDYRSSNRMAELARLVTQTMTVKQVAIDVYFNFSGPIELMNTFLGLNTVRVDLGPVDLLRSYIVEKAQSDGWPAAEIEEMENDFTELFVNDDRPDKELLAFVKVVLDAIRSNTNANRVFPSWSSTLLRSEVDNFLDFVNAFKSSSGDPYFDEIRSCGSVPFAIVMCFYYNRHLSAANPLPSFLQGGVNEHAALHRFLLSCYRALIDGSIGRVGDLMGKCLVNGYTDIALVADEMSQNTLRLPISSSVDRSWLLASIAKGDRNRAKRVFNAMLLPLRANGFGGSFQPLRFGRGANDYHIDHLIPEVRLIENHPGHGEGNTIRNFSPLPGNQNRVAKATSCSSKLQGPNSVYGTLVLGAANTHPYVDWIYTTHAAAQNSVDLDNQGLLEPNRVPPIGDVRMNFIADLLVARL